MDAATTLPETVTSIDGRPPHQTLPIACGTFSSVIKIPDEPESEVEPDPTPEPEANREEQEPEEDDL